MTSMGCKNIPFNLEGYITRLHYEEFTSLFGLFQNHPSLKSQTTMKINYLNEIVISRL